MSIYSQKRSYSSKKLQRNSPLYNWLCCSHNLPNSAIIVLFLLIYFYIFKIQNHRDREEAYPWLTLQVLQGTGVAQWKPGARNRILAITGMKCLSHHLLPPVSTRKLELGLELRLELRHSGVKYKYPSSILTIAPNTCPITRMLFFPLSSSLLCT